jgi:hypothetical protein
MTKGSLGKFRLVFFSLIALSFVLIATIGWLVYKFYPLWVKSKEEKPPEGTP